MVQEQPDVRVVREPVLAAPEEVQRGVDVGEVEGGRGGLKEWELVKSRMSDERRGLRRMGELFIHSGSGLLYLENRMNGVRERLRVEADGKLERPDITLSQF